VRTFRVKLIKSASSGCRAPMLRGGWMRRFPNAVERGPVRDLPTRRRTAIHQPANFVKSA
jgi:hypothetical protein